MDTLPDLSIMQAPSTQQKTQRAQTVLAGSIPVSGRFAAAGGAATVSERSELQAARLPKGPDGNHGDNLYVRAAMGKTSRPMLRRFTTSGCYEVLCRHGGARSYMFDGRGYRA